MKFRYKVLMTNLILLSCGLGIVGYLMIHRNFELAKDMQLQNAIVENNMVQSYVEYSLLQLLGTNSYYTEELKNIGDQASNGLTAASTSFYIRYGEDYVFSSDGGEESIGEELFTDLNTGRKNYCIRNEQERYYIYVTSYNLVEDQPLCVINKYDASDVYLLMNSQIHYFRLLLAGVTAGASLLLYILSVYLTRPLERLNQVADEIAKGHYDIRAEVRGRDEVGLLAENFNEMAEAVEHHIAELNDMVRRREQFVADFTHEIKTPMTAIIGYADTMRSMELPREDEITALNYIFSEGKRLERMSGELFELIYLKRAVIQKVPVQVADLVKEVARITEPALRRKQITLVREVEDACIMGNKELLVTVFLNLVDNARKASGEGSCVWIKGQFINRDEGNADEQEQYREQGGIRAAKQYELSVTDTGIGMTPEEAARICDEFYMVDKSRSRKEGGAGLGMSLAALILERHQATLSVESEPGKGTTMQIVFSEKQTPEGGTI